MSKRNATGSRPSRKRRKGGVSFGETTLDPPDDNPPSIETIRVWTLGRSEATGRLSGTRKNHEHLHEGPSETFREEESSANDWEDVFDPASQEPIEQPPAKPAAKRKRVRIRKENDSVGLISTSPKVILIVPTDKDGGLAVARPDRVRRAASEGRLG